MSSFVLEYVFERLSERRWYMDHLFPEHLLRLIWCFMLMCIYALIELDYLPGKQWKIRPDLHTNSREIVFYMFHSLINMFKWHICPLIIYEILFHQPSTVIYEVPSWRTIIWKSIGYTFIFDMLTHFFHHVAHLYPHFASYMHQAHSIHHGSCARYIYAWNGFYSSALEGLAGFVFFLVAMIPLNMDPVTRLFSILFIHFTATNIHSGYDFPWMFHNWNLFTHYIWHGSVGHYYHHQLGRKNLSTFWTIFDRLSGTYYDHIYSSPSHSSEFIYQRQQINHSKLEKQGYEIEEKKNI